MSDLETWYQSASDFQRLAMADVWDLRKFMSPELLKQANATPENPYIPPGYDPRSNPSYVQAEINRLAIELAATEAAADQARVRQEQEERKAGEALDRYGLNYRDPEDVAKWNEWGPGSQNWAQTGGIAPLPEDTGSWLRRVSFNNDYVQKVITARYQANRQAEIDEGHRQSNSNMALWGGIGSAIMAPVFGSLGAVAGGAGLFGGGVGASGGAAIGSGVGTGAMSQLQGDSLGTSIEKGLLAGGSSYAGSQLFGGGQSGLSGGDPIQIPDQYIPTVDVTGGAAAGGTGISALFGGAAAAAGAAGGAAGGTGISGSVFGNAPAGGAPAGGAAGGTGISGSLFGGAAAAGGAAAIASKLPDWIPGWAKDAIGLGQDANDVLKSLGISGGLGAVLGTGATALGSALNAQQATEAAKIQAQAQVEAARIAADAAKFRPVGVTTNFGTSQFGYDQAGNLSTAGYALSPQMQAQQAKLMGQSEGALSQAQLAPMWSAPMGAAGARAMGLGQGYLAQDPAAQAQRYMSEQQALLADPRAREAAAISARNQAQGRGGFMMGGDAGMAPSNPEWNAFYNANRQQDLGLAAQATQGGQRDATFGAGMVGAGGDLYKGMFGVQQSAYDPYRTALGGATTIEGLGQGALDLGSSLGAKTSTASANAGFLQAQGMTDAANTMNRSNQYSPWGALLSGAGQSMQGHRFDPMTGKAL